MQLHSATLSLVEYAEKGLCLSQCVGEGKKDLGEGKKEPVMESSTQPSSKGIEYLPRESSSTSTGG